MSLGRQSAETGREEEEGKVIGDQGGYFDAKNKKSEDETLKKKEERVRMRICMHALIPWMGHPVCSCLAWYNLGHPGALLTCASSLSLCSSKTSSCTWRSESASSVFRLDALLLLLRNPFSTSTSFRPMNSLRRLLRSCSTKKKKKSNNCPLMTASQNFSSFISR